MPVRMGKMWRDPGDHGVAGDRGANLKVIQSMLGHASAAMTLDRCGQLVPGQAASVAERLDAIARAAVARWPPTPVRLRSRDVRRMEAR